MRTLIAIVLSLGLVGCAGISSTPTNDGVSEHGYSGSYGESGRGGRAHTAIGGITGGSGGSSGSPGRRRYHGSRGGTSTTTHVDVIDLRHPSER